MTKISAQLDGVLVLNKPSGPTSARCIAQIKRLGQKKIGHAGTLDPMASGVLLVLLGQATKISSWLLAGGGKVYRGTLRLGIMTDTWDAEGRITKESSWEKVTPESVCAEIARWRDMKEQPVPPYSAAKHEGRPLYRLARHGLTPAKVKSIEISQAATLDVSLPLVRFRVVCGSGTYVRSLAHSLGMRLGCGAVLTELTREYSYPFGLDAACDLEAVMKNPDLMAGKLRSIPEALPDWPRIEIASEGAADILHGRAIPANGLSGGAAVPGKTMALLIHEGRALALSRLADGPNGPQWTILRGLWN